MVNMKTILRNPNRFKAVLTRFYTGICKVEVKKSITDPSTHKTRPVIETLYKNVQCRLSHESKRVAESYDRNTITQTIMLFMDNIFEIPAGCRITVTQDGVTNEYGAASEPNVFETHQEIELGLWRDWSGTQSKRSSQDV